MALTPFPEVSSQPMYASLSLWFLRILHFFLYSFSNCFKNYLYWDIINLQWNALILSVQLDEFWQVCASASLTTTISTRMFPSPGKVPLCLFFSHSPPSLNPTPPSSRSLPPRTRDAKQIAFLSNQIPLNLSAVRWRDFLEGTSVNHERVSNMVDSLLTYPALPSQATPVLPITAKYPP